MTPEILIVGDASRRRELIREVRNAGYEVTLCEAPELNRRIRTGAPPATIVICLEDADAGVLLATLRRSRRGAAIPVVLFGQLGGEIRDLADVLDLGADHFVRDPYDVRELRDALGELAGPPVASAPDRSMPAPVESPPVESPPRTSWSLATERIPERRADGVDPGDEPPGQGGRAMPRDPVLGQLHATLDRLEARLRERDRGRERSGQGRQRPASSDDAVAPAVRPAELVRAHLGPDGAARGDDVSGPVDLDGLGFEAIPELGDDAGTLDPAELTHSGGAGRADPEGGVQAGTDSRSRARQRARQAVDPDADTFDDGGPAEPHGERTGSVRELDPLERSERVAPSSRTRTESTVRLDDDDTRPRGDVRDHTGSFGERDVEERSGVLSPRRPPRRDGGRARDEGDRRAPAGLPRSGSLSEVDVPTLLWRLHGEGVTGRLRLSRGRIEKQVYFARGEVSFARSGSSADRFVDSLLRRGVLTRAQYETASRLAAREPRRAGELLIEAGLIKDDELETLLGDHLSHMIQSTFPWSDGAWSFEPGAPVDEPITLDVDLGALLLDGIRTRVETSRLRELLGSELNAPRLRREASVDALARRYELVGEEVGWLERFDGRAPLRGLLDEPETDEHGLLALVVALRITGEVSLDGEAGRRARRDPVEIDRDRVVERLRVAREADYFELLGLPRDATRTEVRRAHAEVAETFADRSLEGETVSTMAAELAELRAALIEARDVLMDDALRSAYLAHLDAPEDALAGEQRPR